MPENRRPRVRFLTDEIVDLVLDEAHRILQEIGVLVEHPPAIDLLTGAGAKLGDDRRVRIPADLVDRALATAPRTISLFDREGAAALQLGAGALAFAPGSAALHVHDFERNRRRRATAEDCARFAKLTDALPTFALQSTCVVPGDVPGETADRYRLHQALIHGRKPIVTGTFLESSFAAMHRMLVCVRGSEQALRDRPLAIFDCCPTAPLSWSDLTGSALVACAKSGIPAELISMPMTGATAPVTLLGSVTQHAAESLSGVVIHQLAAPGAPIIWGGCSTAFDMRHGTTPMGAPEKTLIDAADAEIGRRLALPTHAYLALSDAKTLDYQSGSETGMGAVVACLAGFDVISGPGILDFVNTQSLEKLVLDHETCRMAKRLARGVEVRDDGSILDLLREGIAHEQFLDLDHTMQWFRRELLLPGPTTDRQVADGWVADGALSAAERAHREVERILAADDAPSLEASVIAELDRLLE
jgi:trimethylamine---corrinoid protein Co-methyltransferase